jgi:hypothetical protein
MKTSQFGTFIVIIISPFIVFSIFMVYNIDGTDVMPFVILGTTALFLIVGVLLFYKLTILIDDEYVSFKFGFGWYGKKYKIGEIKSCKPVKNSIFCGIGIRKLSNGMLYNVSGLSAIELSFKNRKGIVRIGTNKQNEIAEYLNKKIGNSESIENLIPGKKSKAIFPVILFSVFIAIILYFTLNMVINGQKEPQITIQNKIINISGTYGQEINIDKIYQIDTITNMPAIEFKSNGFDAGKTRKGKFRLKDIGVATLFIKCGYSPFILIKTADKGTIYINFENKQKTIELFKKLRELVK